MNEDRDPVTGMSDSENAALARELYARRDEPEGEEVEAEIAPSIRSVVSVRFNRGELGDVEAAATAAGIPVSTYIRNAALAAAGAVDVDAARRDLASLVERLERLREHLGDAA